MTESLSSPNAPKPDQKPKSPDQLIKGDKTKTELNEDELKKVSGGLKIQESYK